MTTRALISPAYWDVAETRRALRERVVQQRMRSAGHDVALMPEPLLRETSDGSLLQPIRLVVTPTPERLPEVRIARADGTLLPITIEAGPSGSWRLLVPAVDELTQLRVYLAQIGGDEIRLELAPVRRWTVHLIHHTHLDIGYTDPQDTVLAEHLAYLDACLDLASATDDWPDDARFRWSVEALWSFRQWARSRTAKRVAEFIDRVREGRIELTALPFNVHTESCSTDELHELVRSAREVAQRWNIRFTSAMQTDVPGAVAGLPDALGQLDIRYLSVAHNWAGRSVPHLVGGDRLPRLFRWRGPAGHEVLVWVTDTAHGLAYMEGQLLGFDENFVLVDDLLPAFLASTEANPYPYPAGLWDQGGLWGWQVAPEQWREPYAGDVLHLRVQGRFGDNAPPRLAAAAIVRHWNETWAWPHLRLSRNEDFFVDAEERLGDSIPTFEGDWNNWWAEGIGSGAMPMALHRRAQNELADAQTVAALADQLAAPQLAEPARGSTDVYDALALFDEHTWGAADPWTDGDTGAESGEQQWHWKYAQALRSHEGAAQLMRQATARLSARLGGPAAALASYHVVNCCSWSRSGVVEAFVPESLVPVDRPVQVIDARSGEPLPFEERPQVLELHRSAGRFLQVRVDEVPAVGSVRIDVVPAGQPSHDRAGGVPGDGNLALENEYLRVAVDPRRACISSIVDKSSGREFVGNDAAVGFNGYIYDRYASAGGFNHQAHKLVSSPRLELLGSRSIARHAAVTESVRGPLGDRLVTDSTAEGCRSIRTILSLRPGMRALDIENRLAKSATMSKESAYLAFPFAFSSPTIRVEVSGGMVGTGLPTVPGGATHMRAMRQWLSLEEDGHVAAWVTLDAPLVQIGQLSLPYVPYPPTLQPEQATVFSWLHNNLWDTNFPSQQAFEMSFHYRIGVAASAEVGGGAAFGLRTAAEASRPLRAVLARSHDAPVATTSFLSIDDPEVSLVGLTTPEPGRLLLRLQSFADQPVSTTVRLALPVSAAHRATYLGDAREALPMRDGAIRLSLPASGAHALLLTTTG